MKPITTIGIMKRTKLTFSLTEFLVFCARHVVNLHKNNHDVEEEEL